MAPGEMRTARDASRTLGQILDAVTDGALDKAIVMRGGQMAGVVISVERYAELLAAEAASAQVAA